MRVLFIVSDANCHGGTELLAYALLHRLNADGITCWLLSRYPYTGSDPRVLSFAPADFRRWQRLADNPVGKLMGNARSDALFREFTARIARERGADWIVCHTYDLIAAMPTDGPWRTAQVFNWSVRGYESNLRARIATKPLPARLAARAAFEALRWRWHRAMPRLTSLVALTQAAREELRGVSRGVKGGQIAVIPDPVMRDADASQLSSLRNNAIVFVGRLSQEKGVMRLLRIWEKVAARLPRHTLAIWGEGDARAGMERFIGERRLPRVEFRGFTADLAQIYTHADLCCMTSDTEGFGMVLIEAMYFGVPCVSFDCPVSPREIIADAGRTVPCFDEQAYADTVVALLQDPGRLAQLQRAAVRQARQYYIGNIARQWARLFQHTVP